MMRVTINVHTAYPEKDPVEYRYKEQGQHGRKEQAEDNTDGHGRPQDTASYPQRNQTERGACLMFKVLCSGFRILFFHIASLDLYQVMTPLQHHGGKTRRF